MKTFKIIIKTLSFQMNPARRNTLENAVRLTQEEEVMLSFDKFKAIVSFALKLDLKK